jgi:hypothetical protein
MATAIPAAVATPEPTASDEFDLYPDADPALDAHVAQATVYRGPHPTAKREPVPTAATAFGAYAARRRQKVAQYDEDDAPSAWKETYIPLLLGLLGIIGWVVLATAFPMPGISVARTLVIGGAMMAASVVSMVLAMVAAAAMLSLNFGTPASAALKVIGVALFASAIFYGCVRLDPEGIRGAIAGLHVIVIVYWISFATLFDLELQETMITVAIISLVQAMTGCVVLKV